MWATGRHAQIELMMRDWKAFSSTRPAFEEIGQPMILLSDDPPDHQRVRTVIAKGMSPAVLRRMQDMFEAEADRIVRSLLDAPGGLIDGHADLAKKYVLQVFPDAIGLGDSNREMLIRFGHAQFNMFGPKNDIYRASMEAAGEVFEWVATNCKRDTVQPGGICMAMYEAADTGAVTQEEAEILVRTLYSADRTPRSTPSATPCAPWRRTLTSTRCCDPTSTSSRYAPSRRASGTTTRPGLPGDARPRRSRSTG